MIRRDPDREILLEADQRVHFRQVRTLMTSLRALGSTGLSLATEDEPEGASR